MLLVKANKINKGLITSAILLVILTLMWQHLNGGIESHHLLHRADFPAVSNAWGIIIIPVLAWLTARRLHKAIGTEGIKKTASVAISTEFLVAFFVMLLFSLLQSALWEFGYQSFTMYTALGLLIAGLFYPIYRSECILGHVVGASFTFGYVIPLIGILVMAIVSVFSLFCLKPIFSKLLKKTQTPIRME